MRLRQITIRNFRCHKECTLNLRDYTTLVGHNNAGKSSILRAIEILLNQVKPEPDEWHQGQDDEPIVIGGIFESIQNWERKKPGVGGLVYNDEIWLRVSYTKQKTDNGQSRVESAKYEAYTCEETISGLNDTLADCSEQIRQIANDLGLNGSTFRNKNKKELVKSEIRKKYPSIISSATPTWSSDSLSIDPALKQAIPQAVFIPAVRDATDDAKPGAKTPFGILLATVILPALQQSKEFTDFTSAVQKLDNKLRGKDGVEKLDAVKQLEDAIYERMQSMIDAKALLSLASPDVDKFIGGMAGLRIDDGIETPIHLQGHGVQRSLVFALVEAIAKQNAQLSHDDLGTVHRSSLLLFEEPELYVHPHLIRQIKAALKQVAKSDTWQVIVSTHSPFLIDVGEDPMSLVILRRELSKTPPSVTQLATDPFEGHEDKERDHVMLRAALDFHPTVAEAFFAQRAVLVEGDTEIAALKHQPKLLEMAAIDLALARQTSVISCGGKWTIPGLAYLLKLFGIPFRVIHDLDQQGKNVNDPELARGGHPFQANKRIEDVAGKENILVVTDTFEHIFVSGGQQHPKHKPFFSWQKINEICNGNANLDDYPKLKEVLKFAFDV